MGPSIKVEGFKAEEPKAPIEAEGLSPFELERLATMARNKTVLADLGLAGPSPIALHQEAKQRQRLEKRVSNSKKRKNESTESDAPARRSRRLQGTTVNYTEVHKLTDMLDFCETRMGNRAPKAAKGKKGKKDPALCGDSDGEELLVTINAEPMSEEEVEYWRRLSETPNIHTSMPEEVKKRGTGSVIVEGHEKHNFFGRGPEWGKSKVYTTAVTASFGSSCHWCRQKTIDRKVQCSNPDCLSISTWCGSCLWNRHREDILSAIDDPEWLCPACLGECNCSLAGQFACGMYRRGKSKTGALNSIAEIKNGSMTPNQYIRLKMYKGELDWNDARYVSDYVKDKAAAEGLSLEQWALQYHAKRGTVSGRMGLSRSEEAAKLKALP
jgi:hypothetical protein|uniref:Zinc-finger domain-containing protein n=1 Tax=Eutreptiella gymnastica TaxID=73025 RepID=A0A7S4FE42_9EUGL